MGITCKPWKPEDRKRFTKLEIEMRGGVVKSSPKTKKKKEEPAPKKKK